MQLPIKGRDKLVSALLILLFAFSAIYDLTLEIERASVGHILLEACVALIAFVWATRLLFQLWDVRVDLAHSRGEIARLEADNQHWRAESAKWASGLSQSIDTQLTRWKLSPAEKEVALLLMKGLEHKQIAEIRGTTERTARQQAFTLYQKSGLSGRAELTAFFLEDLLVTPS